MATETTPQENGMAFDPTPIFETADEINDTIEMLQEYLNDAAEVAEGGAGPFAHVFAPDAVAFAETQLDFELAKLARLEAA